MYNYIFVYLEFEKVQVDSDDKNHLSFLQET